MVRTILIATVLAGLIGVPAASAAGNPHDQTQPSPSVTSLVTPPTRATKADVPAAGSLVAGALAPGGATAAAGDCGACINTCWYATTRSGPSDWSGHVFLYHNVYFCGNGAWITYASVGQTYDQTGWYHLDSAYGPNWSGGCVGCASIRVSGYILWSWQEPTGWFNGTGSSHLDTTMYAYGAVSY